MWGALLQVQVNFATESFAQSCLVELRFPVTVNVLSLQYYFFTVYVANQTRIKLESNSSYIESLFIELELAKNGKPSKPSTMCPTVTRHFTSKTDLYPHRRQKNLFKKN